jgi:pimeloyl-ACP methyl ester carboxylesterase
MNQTLATLPTGSLHNVNGIEMNVVIAGSGPDILLLHGFPDSHKLWRHRIPAMVAAGFRVIAPDLRGFGLTEIPKGGVAAYRMDQLVADVVSLLNVLGVAKVRLVGHDWGAAIGWQTAILHPDCIDRYVAISVGHPTSFKRGGFEQKVRSWYMLMFQLRGFAELGPLSRRSTEKKSTATARASATRCRSEVLGSLGCVQQLRQR